MPHTQGEVDAALDTMRAEARRQARAHLRAPVAPRPRLGRMIVALSLVVTMVTLVALAAAGIIWLIYFS